MIPALHQHHIPGPHILQLIPANQRHIARSHQRQHARASHPYLGTPTRLQLVGNSLSIRFPPLPGTRIIFSAFLHNSSRIRLCPVPVNEPQVKVAQTRINFEFNRSKVTTRCLAEGKTPDWPIARKITCT
jgi:hypothetical protein